jgi:hypothetical protein
MSTIGYTNALGSVAPRLRITARGRAVVLAIVSTPLVLVTLIFGINAGGAAATLDPGIDGFSTDTFTHVTVESGQSLWDIAAEVAPGVDPREFAADVASLNQLESAELQPGQQLAIPHEYEG